MKKYRILYIICLLLIISCAKDIIDLTSSIEGIVKDNVTSEPLQGVSITLSPSGKSATTGNDGRYSFPELGAGNYSIEFSKVGYEANKKEVTVLAGKPMQVDAMLNKIANALIVNPTSLNFGDLETSKTLFVSCLEQLGNIRYTIKVDADWISLSKSDGNATSTGDKITITIDRSKLSIGNYEKNITITSSYGEVVIPVIVNQVERDIATLTTNAPENITETSLTIKGTIVKTGGLKITSHGHCWSETEQPTINHSKNNLGDTESIGDFTSTLTNLVAGKSYFIRAYAINSKGVAYSEQVSVTMPYIEKPTVSTLTISSLTKDSVILNGEVKDDGNGNIKEYGFYWGLTDNTEHKVKINTIDKTKFSYTLKSLESKATYYYKAYAINEKGESTGEIKTFTSLDKDAIEGIPTVITNDATDITINSAMLNGVITNSGNSEIVQRGFYFGTSESSMTKKIISTTDSIISLHVTDLADGTTYCYKAFAVNSKGESCGEIKNFFTLTASAPTVVTNDASDITIDGAMLNGVITNSGDSKIVQRGFYFGTSESSMTKKTVNTTDSIISLHVTDLADGTTYCYKAFAVNSKGESCGEIRNFMTNTANAPTVETNYATNVSFESAVLNGAIIEMGTYEVTQCGFYFGDSENSMSKRIVNTHNSKFSLSVSELNDGTKYYYKAFAINKKGEKCGDIMSFTTVAGYTAAIETKDATDVTIDCATLNAVITDEGSHKVSERGFYFGTSENSMNRMVVNTSNLSISLTLSNLSSSTTYYFKAFAVNKKGESIGDVKMFTTLAPKEPTIQTNNATNISYEEATLNGVILNEGTYDVTEYGFYFGTIQNPTVRYQVGDSYKTAAFYKSIAKLNDNTTYYYKAYAKNSVGYSFGEVQTFKTKMKPKIYIIDYSFSKNKQSPTSRCDIRIEAEIEVNDATVIEQGILSGRSGSNSEISLESYYSKVQCEMINNRIVGVIDGSKHISYSSYNPIRAYIICDDGKIFYSEQIIAYTPKYSDL